MQEKTGVGAGHIWCTLNQEGEMSVTRQKTYSMLKPPRSTGPLGGFRRRSHDATHISTT